MKNIYIKTVVLFIAVLTVSMAFFGCQSMDDKRHNTEEGRTGVSGYALMVNINPSRVPANNNAKTYAHIRFFRMKDMAPVPNTRVRLMLSSDDPEAVGVVHFGEHTLVTDAVTNSAGEVTVTMYVESLPKYVAEVMLVLDVQSTIEYDKWNTVVYKAKEEFYVYNPFYDGSPEPTATPNKSKP
ncbi:MAG: hypothetical protein WBM02_08435 [bacterium]